MVYQRTVTTNCSLEGSIWDMRKLEECFTGKAVQYWNKSSEKWGHLHPWKFARDQDLTVLLNCPRYLLQYEKLGQRSVLLQPWERSAVLLDEELIVSFLPVPGVGEPFLGGRAGG